MRKPNALRCLRIMVVAVATVLAAAPTGFAADAEVVASGL
jgi:hypothetical protein